MQVASVQLALGKEQLPFGLHRPTCQVRGGIATSVQPAVQAVFGRGIGEACGGGPSQVKPMHLFGCSDRVQAASHCERLAATASPITDPA